MEVTDGKAERLRIRGSCLAPRHQAEMPLGLPHRDGLFYSVRTCLLLLWPDSKKTERYLNYLYYKKFMRQSFMLEIKHTNIKKGGASHTFSSPSLSLKYQKHLSVNIFLSCKGVLCQLESIVEVSQHASV